MRTCLAVLIFVMLSLCGCGPYRITLTELSDYTDPNEDLAGREVQLVLKDGRETMARDVRLGPVETSWLDPGSVDRRAVASTDVSFVKVRKRGRGALKGLLYGGGSGTAMASAMYWSDPDEPYASVVFVFIPAIGALMGVLGGTFADADIYEFNVEPPAEAPAQDFGAAGDRQEGAVP